MNDPRPAADLVPPARAALRTATRICPLCEATCGLVASLDGDRVVSLRGDDADPFSRGYLCPKAIALKDLHEDPDRLRRPLVKRDGRFVEVSWEEAYAEIARRLPPVVAAHGRDALGFALGNPNVHRLGLGLYAQRLLRAAGSRNVFSASTLDQMPHHVACGWAFGHALSVPVPDIDRCDLLLMIGANPMASNGSMWTVPDFRGRLREMQARGGRLVVVDPRRTETAAVADTHFFVRPGTDALLLLGLLHVLFDEGLADAGAAAPHVAPGARETLAAAVARFAPERTAAHCGVPAEAQRQLARDLARTRRAAVYSRIGASTQRFGTLNCALVNALNLFTGHLDAEGGAMFTKAAAFAANTMGAPGRGRGLVTGRTTSRVSKAPEVLGEYPMGCLSEEIETAGEGQVRALVTIASNAVLSAPNGARLSQALEGLDFMLSLDIYVNETTRHADVILPGGGPFEESHYDLAFAQLSCRNHARYSEPLVAPAPGAEAEWQALLRLTALARGREDAMAPGFDLAAFDTAMLEDDLKRAAGALPEPQFAAVMAALGPVPGPDRLLDLGMRSGPYGDMFGMKRGGLSLAKVKAEPHGVDLGPLAPRLPELLRTPSGRIEPWHDALAPELDAAAALLEAAPAPLVVVGRRDVRSNNSWMHNLPVLAKGPERCTALMHPRDAAALGLAAGERVRLLAVEGDAARRGAAIELPVVTTEDMMPGVVSVPHGWGHDLEGVQLRVAGERPGANLNALLDETRRDPLSGTSVLGGVPVRAERVIG